MKWVKLQILIIKLAPRILGVNFLYCLKSKLLLKSQGGEKFKGLKGEGNRYPDGGVKKAWYRLSW